MIALKLSLQFCIFNFSSRIIKLFRVLVIYSIVHAFCCSLFGVKTILYYNKGQDGQQKANPNFKITIIQTKHITFKNADPLYLPAEFKEMHKWCPQST